ncbi:MAG: signal recognition particle receptor subunit alpha [Rhodocyclaceae bacterium]|nr:signal recognition particle receptor subunit alpha [Rhodocyclaceae bacterium]
MLDNLTQRLSRVVKTLRGQARLTEDNIAEALREVRMALLEADVALPVVRGYRRTHQGEGRWSGRDRQSHSGPGAGGGCCTANWPN